MSSSDELSDADCSNSTLRAAYAKIILQKGKLGAAAFFNGQIRNNGSIMHLNAFLDTILSPTTKIDDTENIEWCKSLIAGGRTITEFSAIGK